MSPDATIQSVRDHQAPQWFNDAKLGIFIHWGLYSVPAWAPLGDDPFAMMREHGFGYYLRHNPYAEWYQNTLQYADSPTAAYHREQFGDLAYRDFDRQFEERTADWDPAPWADLFRTAGARYVVLTTKHHDGYTLWPSRHPNPFHPDYGSPRDLVGDLTEAIRQAGMRMGLYYSGGIDWTFTHPTMESMIDFLDMIPQSAEYTEYANAHWRELIERYQPSVLWNDIGYPAAAEIEAIMAEYYQQVPDGVVNDRFQQRKPIRPWLKPIIKPLTPLLSKMMSTGRPTRGVHSDFVTPEYAVYDEIKPYKWECCRGLSSSFGYNALDSEETTLTVTDLTHCFVDIVSKNGNLLINVGPTADGTIVEMQRRPLIGLGAWLATNGDAIYGTRPWVVPQATTLGGHPLRFTQKDETLNAILFERPSGHKVVIPGLQTTGDTQVQLLGHHHPLNAHSSEGKLVIEWPADVPESPAYTLAISPRPTWRG